MLGEPEFVAIGDGAHQLVDTREWRFVLCVDDEKTEITGNGCDLEEVADLLISVAARLRAAGEWRRRRGES